MLFLVVMGFLLSIVGILTLIGQVNPAKSSYKKGFEEFLKEELKKNPGYINWLKVAHGGKNYKLGLRILEKIKKQ